MTDWEEIARQSRERIAAQAAEISALKAQLAGDKEFANSNLQMRADRQRKALDRLNRKVLSQRFRLNLLKTLGRDVSYDEYMEAKIATGNDRIEDYVSV